MDSIEIQDTELARIEAKIDAVMVSAEKTRKYVLILVASMLAMAVLPIILGALMLPFLMSTLGGVYGV